MLRFKLDMTSVAQLFQIGNPLSTCAAGGVQNINGLTDQFLVEISIHLTSRFITVNDRPSSICIIWIDDDHCVG